MTKRYIDLVSEEDCYLIHGYSHLVIWKSKGTAVVETPEMGFRGGIDGAAVKGVSLDQKTRELSLQFLQSGKPNQINLGEVTNYDKALEWVKSVNDFYSHQVSN